MSSRHRARQYAVQMLYQWDLLASTPRHVLEYFWTGEDAAPEERRFAENLFHRVVECAPELNPIIERHSTNWRLERMSVIDRNILRLGAYELLYERQTPISVILDEAIELARDLSSEDAARFINGILDKVGRLRDHGDTR